MDSETMGEETHTHKTDEQIMESNNEDIRNEESGRDSETIEEETNKRKRQ